MNKTLFRLICLSFAMIPMATVAQTNIKSAIDAIIKCPEVRMTEGHSLEKNPETKLKTGQSDIYNFVLPVSKIRLVNNLVVAFDKDGDMSYSFNKGTATSGDPDVNLAVGEDGSRTVHVTEANRDYMYALFLPSREEDPDGNYRYAYGFSYKKEEGKIMGRIVVTYGTTLKYRQQKEKQQRLDNLKSLQSLSNGLVIVENKKPSDDKWFPQVMSCFQSMTSANTQTRISLATKAYEVIQDSSKYADATEADKNAVREILKGMISDRKYSDSILNSLLKQCLTSLK